jgi:signal transduction histidine kinase
MAGMAEVATGILHNVGNTLNSVSVSATLLEEAVGNLPVTRLSKTVDLLQRHQDDLGAFMQSSQGKKLPLFLATLGLSLEEERQSMQREIYTLLKNIDHIKHVVGMQQGHAKAVGVVERVRPEELVDDALKLHESDFAREGILLKKDLEKVGTLSLDRHRVLQILVNLISNARQATLDSPELDKVVTVRIRARNESGLLIEVEDNGVGIEPHNAARIFQQGFTTKLHGHGFGLHNSILVAKELGGSLSYRSEGPGKGACFSLVIPDAERGVAPTASHES